MFQWTLAGMLVVAAGVLMKWYLAPVQVQVTPPGAVIFNPAPSTGSATFLGDITGNPVNNYWNVTTQISDIPSGFITSQSSFAGQNLPTVLYNSPLMSSK
jgi:hypothetical protein